MFTVQMAAVPFVVFVVGCRGRPSPAGDPFEGCSLLHAHQEATSLMCGPAFVRFGEVDGPFDAAAAERDISQFEEPFPSSSSRRRSVETLGGQPCPAVTVTDDASWSRLVVVPAGAKTRVLSCGHPAGSGRCLPILKALAVDGLPERFRAHEGGAP
jgi:hypothetical protein